MKKWYILFTNYENSLATMKRLVKTHLPKGCGAYIPVTISGNKYHKTRIYNKPVYPFYIFICCTDESQLKILSKKMAPLNIVGYFLQNQDGSYATLSSEQIKNMETNILKPMESDDNPYYPGESVEIVAGPMSGISGMVTSVSGELVFVTLQTVKGRYIDLPVLKSDLIKKEINDGK